MQSTWQNMKLPLLPGRRLCYDKKYCLLISDIEKGDVSFEMGTGTVQHIPTGRPPPVA
jgi:hypothetical protein